MTQGQQLERAVESGISLLRQSLDKTSTRALLILCDPMLANPIGDEAKRLQIPIHSLRFSYRDLGKEHKPYLIVVEDEAAQERFVNLTIRVAMTEALVARNQSPAPRSVCAWLLAPLEQLQTIRDALTSRALQFPPEAGAQKRLFRFWDPRVFEHLPRILGASALGSWLGCPLCWTWVDSTATMRSQTFDVSSCAAVEPFTPTQWSALERIEDLNQALRLTNSLEQPDFVPIASLLDSALLHAQTLKLTQSLDRVTYAALSHSLGGRFETHPVMRPHFELAAQGGSLSDQLALIDQPTWEKLREDMTQQHAHTRSVAGVTP